MMAVCSILLLLTLTDAATGLFYKKYLNYDEKLSWADAQAYCRKAYVDLSIIDTEKEFESFKSQTSKYEERWIGLSKNPGDPNFTQWTDGTVLNFTRWNSNKPDNINKENCVFTYNDTWDNGNCTKPMKSFCYTWAPRMIVVQEKKNWEEALVYCRTFYTDLVSLTTETDHCVVKNRSRDILTPTFWTGLRFMDGSWFWVNLRSPQSLNSLPSCPVRPFWCGARNIGAGIWENRDCEEKMNFICYQDIW